MSRFTAGLVDPLEDYDPTAFFPPGVDDEPQVAASHEEPFDALAA